VDQEDQGDHNPPWWTRSGFYILLMRSKPTVRKYGVVVATQHQDHKTIEKAGLQEKIGPFKILAKVGTSSYKLALPPSRAIHNTFHISLLEAYQDNRFPSQIKEPPPPIQIEGEDEYERDEIIDSRLRYNKLQYRAKWKGYLTEHDKVWYPAENFNNAEHTVQRFHQRYPRKPGVDTRHDQQIVLSTSPSCQTRTTLTHTRQRRPARRRQRYPHEPRILGLTKKGGGARLHELDGLHRG